jgi:hypothetical protein
VKLARSIADRDLKPYNMPAVEIRWVDEVDPKRARRVAEILANILDTAGTPEDGRR